MEGTSDVTAEGVLSNWHIESKGYSFPRLDFKFLDKWLEQTVRDAKFNAKIVVFIKLKGQDFICAVPIEHCSEQIKHIGHPVFPGSARSIDYNGLLHSLKYLAITSYIPLYIDLGASELKNECMLMTPETFAAMIR